MWKGEDLKGFRDVYSGVLAVIPSTNQIVALLFKIMTDIGRITGRAEEDKTVYMAIVSGIQPRAKRIAHKRVMAKPRRRRQQGKSEVTKEEEREGKKRVRQQDVRGKEYSVALMEEIEHHVEVATAIEDYTAGNETSC
jgi:hypothetical protein